MNTVRASKGRAGFSLIELMVVVSVVALVVAAAMPSFGLALRRNRMREAAMLIVRPVYLAHGRAAQKVTCHRVHIRRSQSANNGGDGGWVELAEYTLGDSSNCSLSACNDATNWRVLTTSMVGTNQGLVGDDVSIAAFYQRQGNTWGQVAVNDLYLYFDPSGETRVQFGTGNQCNLADGVISIRPDSGPDRHVRFTSGGSVRYTAIAGIN